MKLIKEQVRLLKKEREELINSKINLVASKNDTRALVHENQTNDSDYDTIVEIAGLAKRIAEINSLLETSKIVKNKKSDYVDVGSIFTVVTRLKGDDEDLDESNFTLVEKNVTSAAIENNFISLDSPLGRAVYQRTVGEYFEYLVPGTKTDTVIEGTVTEINKKYKPADLTSTPKLVKTKTR